MIIGVVAVNSADESFTFKQAVGVGMGFVVMLIISVIDYHFICKFSYAIYIVNAALLILVLLVYFIYYIFSYFLFFFFFI